MIDPSFAAPFELKFLAESGTFEGYASVFGVTDNVNDMITPGAFRDSLVRWQEEDSLLALSVCDGGGASEPAQVEAAPDDLGGRGLAIVDALSSKWWVEHASQLHTVHVRLALD